MAGSVIAAELATLREFCKTPADIARSMKKLREIGYEAVERAGLGPIEPAELRRIADGEGLRICSTHSAWHPLRDETDRVIEEHQILGCEYAGNVGMPSEYCASADACSRFAKEASEVGRRMAERGIKFFYHNHSYELARFGGRTCLEIVFDESDARYVLAQIDTYWIQHGGGDPCVWIRKLAGRLPLLHLKDMRMRGREQLFAEVGEGNLNWEGILAEATKAGVQWYVVEQDLCYERDPFDSLRISLENLKRMGLDGRTH